MSLTADTPVADALDDLLANVPGLTGALIASADGLPIAHRMRDGDPAGLAAIAATTAGLGGRIVDDLALGDVAEAVVRGSQGYFAVYRAGDGAVLAVVAAQDANLGRIHLAARRTATAIAEQHLHPNP